MHTQYFVAMTFSAIYQHTYPHKDSKWHIEGMSYNFQLSTKGETPYGSIVCMDIINMKSYRKTSHYKCMLLTSC